MHSLLVRKVETGLKPHAEEITLLREALAQGDTFALRRWLSPHQRPLYTFCRDTLGHAEDAEDAVQETYLRALNALPRFRGECSLRNWLFRIALSVCLDWKRRRRPTESLEAGAEERPSASGDPATITLERIRLQEALANLMPRQRAILLLKEWEGWSVAEIAEAMRWNERKVHNELYQARKTLTDWTRLQQGQTEGEAR